MPVVGVAEVLIRPSLKDFQREVGSAVDGVSTGPAPKRAGRNLGSTLASAAKKTMKVGAVAAGAGLATILGTGIKKGFERLSAIERAKAQLAGLGYTATDVKSIMDDVNGAVKGTAYGLDEAASAAGGALASGIKPGKELTRYLTLVADAATQANVGFGDMALMMGKVQGQGKLTGDVVRQMGENGLHVVPMLAEAMGKSEAEIRKMVSNSEISADQFKSILENKFGGSAQRSGATLEGAFRNSIAALGRAGANLMSGVYPKFTEFFQGVIEWMKPVEEWAEKAGAAIGDWLGRAVDGLKDSFNSFMDKANEFTAWIEENKDPIGFLASAVGGAAGAWLLWKGAVELTNGILDLYAKRAKIAAGAQWLLNAAMSANPIGLVVTVIGAAVGALIYLYNTNDTVKNAIDSAWNWIKDTVVSAWENWIKPAWDAMVGFIEGYIVPAAQVLWDTMKSVWSGIQDAVGVAWEFLQPIFGAIGAVVSATGGIFSWLYHSIIEPIWGLISWWIQVNWNVMRLIFDTAIFVIKNLGSVFSWLYNEVIKPVWDGIQSAISWAWNNAIKPVFDAIGGFIRATLGPAFTWLKDSVVTPVWNGIKNTISSVWNNGIKPVLTAFRDFVTGPLVDGVKKGASMIGDAWKRVENLFATPINWVINNVWNGGIKKAFDNVAKAVGSGATLPAATPIRARAKGGYTPPGWTLVGEEGPELVNFTHPNRVYTAAETAAALAAGRDIPPSLERRAIGRTPAESLLPAGGGVRDWASNTWGSIKSGAKRAWDATGGKAIKWVRGGLAKAAGLILNPLQALISRTVGQWGLFGDLISGFTGKSIKAVQAWIRGKDAEAGPDGPEYTGVKGGFARPSRGPITSRFGPRWGSFHAGIDIAGGGPTYAAWNGTVMKTGWNIVPGRTGIGILLSHGGSKYSYYGHNPVGGVKVRPGQTVKAGQRIGTQGATGNVTGVHLHFEEHRGGVGRAINPGYLFRDRGGNLPPGLNMVLNNTGRDEWILNHDQMAALAGRHAMFPDRVWLQVDGREFEAYVKDKADERLGEHVSDVRRARRQFAGAR